MMPVELIKRIHDTPGIFQKDLIQSGTSHKLLMVLLKESKVRREWSGYGYKLYLTGMTVLKLEEYVKTHLMGGPSCEGLHHYVHGEKFQKAFDKCFGLKELP